MSPRLTSSLAPKPRRRTAPRDELQTLPGVGPSIAGDLRHLGIRSIGELARRNAERLYDRLCEVTGKRQDPCVLYVFRCAVYASRTPLPDPALLRWESWNGRMLDARGRVVNTAKGLPARYARS